MRLGSGRYIFLMLLLPLLAAASVHLEVDKRIVTKGDTVTFTIRAEGKDVEFPTLKSIDGFPILGTSKKSSISIINGAVSRSVAKSYTFAPMRDVTIPKLEVKVDGKRYETEPVKIEVRRVEPQQPNGGEEASLRLSLDKKEARVGEALRLEVSVRYPKDKNYIEVQVPRPEFANFWIKQIGEKEVYDRGSYFEVKYRYLLFPQKAGEFKLGPLTARLARRVITKSPFKDDPFFDDDFFNSMFARLERRSILSNTLEVNVSPLPSGVELYGEFDIEASADKTRVEANKPVHITVRVKGRGNIDDVKKFEPEIADAVVYADDPKIEAYIENGEYGGTFTQHIMVVADRNYTVAPFTIRYFDPESEKVVQKRTDPISIEVTGGSAGETKQEPKNIETAPAGIGSENIQKSVTTPEKEIAVSGWLYLLIGFAAGAGAAYSFIVLKGFNSSKKRGESPLAKRIQRAKSDKELLQLLLPYAKRSRYIEEVVSKLEENIFESGKNRIEKKRVVEEIEDIEEPE